MEYHQDTGRISKEKQGFHHQAISILGSTGSVGKNTLNVLRHLKGSIKVKALACLKNIDLLEEQIHEFKPELVAIYSEEHAKILAARFPKLDVMSGMEGIKAVASYQETSLCVSAISGAIGIEPTFDAVRSGKDIALANKEVLVAAGALLMDEAKKHKIQIIPMDSEHSAIFQCLQGENSEDISRIIITASGGPFRQYSLEDLKKVTPEMALKHPNWFMGVKITIDSSTLMNKGLEVIEAHWLFNVGIDRIDVVVHPQSLVHSFVEWVDGSLMAQIAEPDMVLPIQYALTYPRRVRGILKPFDFSRFGRFDFYAPDMEKFRCLKLAYEAVKVGGSLPCYMNAANEVLVHRFMNCEISWLDIGRKLEQLMERHKITSHLELGLLKEVDQEARMLARHA